MFLTIIVICKNYPTEIDERGSLENPEFNPERRADPE